MWIRFWILKRDKPAFKALALWIVFSFLGTTLLSPFAQARVNRDSALFAQQIGRCPYLPKHVLTPNQFVSTLNNYISKLETLKDTESNQKELENLITTLKDRLFIAEPIEWNGQEYILGAVQGKNYRTHFVLEYGSNDPNSVRLARKEIKPLDEFKAIFGTLRDQSNIALGAPTLLAMELPSLMANGTLLRVETADEKIEKILIGKRFSVKGNWKLADLRSKKPIWPAGKIRYEFKNGKVVFYKVKEQLKIPFDSPLVFPKPNTRKRGSTALSQTTFTKYISRNKSISTKGFIVVAPDPLREFMEGFTRDNAKKIQEDIENKARETGNVHQVTLNGIEFYRGISRRGPVWMFYNNEQNLDAFIKNWSHLGVSKRERKKSLDFIRNLKVFDKDRQEVEFAVSVRSFRLYFKEWNKKEFALAIKTLKEEIEAQFTENEDEKTIHGIPFYKRKLERSGDVILTSSNSKQNLIEFEKQYKDRGFVLRGDKSGRKKSTAASLERALLNTMTITEDSLINRAFMLLGLLSLQEHFFHRFAFGMDQLLSSNPEVTGLHGVPLAAFALSQIIGHYGGSNHAKRDPVKMKLKGGYLLLGSEFWKITEDPNLMNAKVMVHIEEGIDEVGEEIDYPILIEFTENRLDTPSSVKMCEVRNPQDKLVFIYHPLQTIDQDFQDFIKVLAKKSKGLTLLFTTLDQHGMFTLTGESSLPVLRHKKNEEIEVNLDPEGKVRMIWHIEHKMVQERKVRTVTRLEPVYGTNRTLFPLELEFVDKLSKDLVEATGGEISEDKASIVAWTLVRLQRNSLDLLEKEGLLTPEDVNSIDKLHFNEPQQFYDLADKILQLIQTYKENKLNDWQIGRLLSTKLIPWETLKKWQKEYHLKKNINLILDVLFYPDIETYLQQAKKKPSPSNMRTWEIHKSKMTQSNRMALVNIILGRYKISHGLQSEQSSKDLEHKKVLFVGLEDLSPGEVTRESVAIQLFRNRFDAVSISPFARTNDKSSDLYRKGGILNIPTDANLYDLIIAEPFFDEYFNDSSMHQIGFKTPTDYYAIASSEIMRVLKDNGKFLVLMRSPLRAEEFKNVLVAEGFKVEVLASIGEQPILEFSKAKIHEEKEAILRRYKSRILDSYDFSYATQELRNMEYLVEGIPLEGHQYYSSYVLPVQEHLKKIKIAHARAQADEMFNEIISSFNSALEDIPELNKKSVENLVKYLDDVQDDISKAVLAYYQVVSSTRLKVKNGDEEIEKSFIDVDPATLIKKDKTVWDNLMSTQISQFHRYLVDQNAMPDQIEEQAKIILALKILENYRDKKLIKEYYEFLIRRVITKASISAHALMDHLGLITALVPSYLESVLAMEGDTDYTDLEQSIKEALENLRSLNQQDWESLTTDSIIQVFAKLIDLIGNQQDHGSNINFLRGKPTGIEQIKTDSTWETKAKLADFIKYILYPYYLAFVPTILKMQIAFLNKEDENSLETINKFWQQFGHRIGYLEDDRQGDDSIRNRFSDWWKGVVIEKIEVTTVTTKEGFIEKKQTPIKKKFDFKPLNRNSFIRPHFKNGASEALIPNPIGLQRVFGEILKNCGEKNAEEGKSWDTFVDITFNQVKIKNNWWIDITIEDNGRGIPEEMLKVDPLTGKQVIWNRGGTTGGKDKGIGMSEAWLLITDVRINDTNGKELRGTIVADNESTLRVSKNGERGGARFTIRIPEVILGKKPAPRSRRSKIPKFLMFALQVPLFLITGVFLSGGSGGSYIFGQSEPEWKSALRKGMEAFKNKNWTEAIKLHLEALRKNPPLEMQSTIRTHLAEVYIHNKQYRASLDEIRLAEKDYDQKAYLKYLTGAVYFDWALEAKEAKDANAFIKRIQHSEEAFKIALEIHEAVILKDPNSKLRLNSTQIEETANSIAKINIFAGGLEDLKRVEELLFTKYPVQLGNNQRVSVLIGLSAAYVKEKELDRALKILKTILQTNDHRVQKTVVEGLLTDNDYIKHLYSLLQNIATGKILATLTQRKNAIEILLALGSMETNEKLSSTELKILLRSLRRELQDTIHRLFPDLRIREYVTLANRLFHEGWGDYPFQHIEELNDEILRLKDEDSIYNKIKEMETEIDQLNMLEENIRQELRHIYLNAGTVYLSLVRRFKREFMMDEAYKIYYKFISDSINNFKSLDPVEMNRDGEWKKIEGMILEQFSTILKNKESDSPKDRMIKIVETYHTLLAIQSIGQSLQSGKLTPEISHDLMKFAQAHEDIDGVNEIVGSAYGFLKYVLPVKVTSEKLLPLDLLESLIQSLEEYINLVNEGRWKVDTKKIIAAFENLIAQIQKQLPSLLKGMSKVNLNSVLTEEEKNLSKSVLAESGLKLLPNILRHRISFWILSLATLFFLTPATFAENIFFKSMAYANAQSYKELTLTQQQELYGTIKHHPNSQSQEPIQNQIIGIATLLGDRVNIKGYEVKEENVRFILNHGDLNSSIFEIKDFLEEIKIRSSQDKNDGKIKDEIVIVTDLESSKQEVENFLLKEGVSIEDVRTYVRTIVQAKEKGKFNLKKLISEHNLADGYTLRVLNKNGLWSFVGLMNQLWKDAFQENRMLFIEKSLFSIKIVGYSQ